MSNFYCHPGKAGGSPLDFRMCFLLEKPLVFLSSSETIPVARFRESQSIAPVVIPLRPLRKIGLVCNAQCAAGAAGMVHGRLPSVRGAAGPLPPGAMVCADRVPMRGVAL